MKKIIRTLLATWIISIIIGVFSLCYSATLFTHSLKISVDAADVAAQTVTVSSFPQLGWIQEVKVTIPDTTNNVTHTFSIVDPAAVTRYSLAALAEAASTILFPNRVIGDGYVLSMLPSGATGNDITITIYVSYWR